MSPLRCRAQSWKSAAKISKARRWRILCPSTMSRRKSARRWADMQTKLLIDGTLVAGEGAVERILDPATGQRIAEGPEASVAQVNAAGAGAEKATAAAPRRSHRRGWRRVCQAGIRQYGQAARRSAQ